MPCKHLLRYSHGTNIWSVATCSAKNAPYVPSLHELESYCQSSKHSVCPAYLFSCEGGCLAGESGFSLGISSRQLNQQKSA